MIVTLSGRESESARPLYEELLKLRYQVFVENRHWSVPTRQRMDVDQYDAPDALYFFDRDKNGRIGSHVRLTPAHKHSTLADYFPHLVEPRFNPREKGVVECARFVVMPPNGLRSTKRRMEAELFAAVVSYCMDAGYRYMQAVLDVTLVPTFFEVVPQSFTLGLSSPYGGGPDAPGGGHAIAVRSPVNPRTLRDIMDYGNLRQAPTSCLAVIQPPSLFH